MKAVIYASGSDVMEHDQVHVLADPYFPLSILTGGLLSRLQHVHTLHFQELVSKMCCFLTLLAQNSRNVFSDLERHEHLFLGLTGESVKSFRRIIEGVAPEMTMYVHQSTTTQS